MPPIIDIASGSKMFYFNDTDDVLFIDNRSEVYEVKDRGKTRTVDVHPDIKADFTDLPFKDSAFNAVIFDPPHLKKLGKTSWLAKKYGKLDDNWPQLIHDGFHEGLRVLKPNHVLIFKWNEYDIPLKDVLKAIDYDQGLLFGNKQPKKETIKTHWLVFIKKEILDD